MIHWLTYRRKSDGFNLNYNTCVNPRKIIYIYMYFKKSSDKKLALTLFDTPFLSLLLGKATELLLLVFLGRAGLREGS